VKGLLSTVDRFRNDLARSNLNHGSDCGQLGRDSDGNVVADAGRAATPLLGSLKMANPVTEIEENRCRVTWNLTVEEIDLENA
jgi:hypothetical protein